MEEKWLVPLTETLFVKDFRVGRMKTPAAEPNTAVSINVHAHTADGDEQHLLIAFHPGAVPKLIHELQTALAQLQADGSPPDG